MFLPNNIEDCGLLDLLQGTATEDIAGHRMTSVSLERPRTEYDISVFVHETEARVGGAWHYDADVFDGATVERFMGLYHEILAAALAAPDRPIAEILGRAGNDVPRMAAAAGAPD